jgi:hypothetical protein
MYYKSFQSLFKDSLLIDAWHRSPVNPDWQLHIQPVPIDNVKHVPPFKHVIELHTALKSNKITENNWSLIKKNMIYMNLIHKIVPYNH